MSTLVPHGYRPFFAFAAICAGITSACSKRTNEQVAPSSREPIRVAAASDLANAFEDLGKEFTKETDVPVQFTFGSTGLLTTQIRHGAPFSVFAAAQQSYVDDVVASGDCLADTKALYATGRLVVFTKEGAAPRLEDLKDARFRRIAIANPEHAPYGKAAEQALKKAGVHDAVKDRLVFGGNAQQTLQFVRTGNADVALVPLSLTIGEKNAGNVTSVTPDMHEALQQALVVCPRPGQTENARRFAAYVNSANGRAVMRRYGFLLPGE